MRHHIFSAVLVIGLAGSALSQTTNHSWEVHAQVSQTNTNLIFGESAVGFRLGTAWKPSPSFGLVADFSSQPNSGSKEISFTSFMGGPRVYSDERYRLSGFLQALAGAYRSATRQSTSWNYIWGAGAGVDIRVTEHVALRPLEFDLMLLGSNPSGVLAARASSGLVFRF
jgi:opacity protein-like surface antigen